MNDDAIRKKLAGRAQYENRLNALQSWEKGASKKERALFESYVKNWLELRADGVKIGWKSFSELCCEDIPSFNLAPQGLKGALSERIKRL